MRHQRRLPLLLGRALRGLGRLDLGGQGLGLREQRLLLVALGLRDQLAELLLLRRAWPRSRRSPRAGRRRRPAPGPRRRRTARAWPGRRARGRGRLGGCAGRSCGAIGRASVPARLSGATSTHAARDTRRRHTVPAHARPTPRHRPRLGRRLLRAVRGCSPSASPPTGPGWSTSTTAASPRRPGRPTATGCTTCCGVVEVAFGTIAMTIYTVVLCALLFRRHRRAAFFTAGVMIATSLGDDADQGPGRPRPAAVAEPRARCCTPTPSRPATPRRSPRSAGS